MMTTPYLQPHTADGPPKLVCGDDEMEFNERSAMYWAFQLMHWLYWKESLVNQPSQMHSIGERNPGKTPNNLQYSRR